MPDIPEPTPPPLPSELPKLRTGPRINSRVRAARKKRARLSRPAAAIFVLLGLMVISTLILAGVHIAAAVVPERTVYSGATRIPDTDWYRFAPQDSSDRYTIEGGPVQYGYLVSVADMHDRLWKKELQFGVYKLTANWYYTRIVSTMGILAMISYGAWVFRDEKK